MPVHTPSLSIKVPPPLSPGSVALQSTPGSLSAQSVSSLPISTQSPFVPISPMDLGTQAPSTDKISVDGPLAYQQSNPNSNLLASPLSLNMNCDAYNNTIMYEQQRQYHQPVSPIPVYEHAFGVNANATPAQHSMGERLMPPPDLINSVRTLSPVPSPKSPLPEQISPVSSQKSTAHPVLVPGMESQVPISPRSDVPMMHQYQ